MSIFSTHSGAFAQGDTASNMTAPDTYNVTVTNTGTSPTKGKVTVTDTLPSGLSLVSMAGAGWTCVGNVCTRTDALVSGGAYPAISVIVNVASDAPTSVVNEVRVTGGTAPSDTYGDTTKITIP